MNGRPFDLGDFRAALDAKTNRARSVEEIEAWLKSQPNVKSVKRAQFLMKSNPPQREFAVTVDAGGGATIDLLVDFYDDGDRGFRLKDVRPR